MLLSRGSILIPAKKVRGKKKKKKKKKSKKEEAISAYLAFDNVGNHLNRHELLEGPQRSIHAAH